MNEHDNTDRVVFAVVQGNYFPYEVDSLFSTREAAQLQCDEFNNLTGDWRVVELPVHD